MRINAVKLVFNKIMGVTEFADVMVECPDLGKQTVCPNGFCPCFNKVGNNKTMVIGAGCFHHKPLQKRMIKVHEFHKTETGGIAKHHFQNRTEGKKDNNG